LSTPRKLDDEALATFTEAHADWAVEDGFLTRRLKFADFEKAFAFMTRVAALAEAQNHHPNWSNVWNRVEIQLRTHEADALTERDTRLASAIDAVVEA